MIHYSKNPVSSENIPPKVTTLLEEGINQFIVIKDGHIVGSNLESVEGLYIDTFDNALTEQSDLFSKIDMLNSNQSDAYKYTMEEANSGLVISVKRNFNILEHIHVFILQEEHDLVHNTIINVEESSRLKVTEYYCNINPSSINLVSHYLVNENAELNYTSVNLFDPKAVISIIREGFVNRYGNLKLNHAEVSDSITDVYTNVSLLEPHAVSTVKTVALTNETQNARFEQNVQHFAKETEGYIENYGVSSDESCLVFEGIGKIHKGMKQSVARQKNKGIILSPKARLDANPLLLIDEYDVIASHGAAIGQIDEQQLYYLMSRGLSRVDAERLIIGGFLSPILTALESDAIKDAFLESVERKTKAF